MKHIPNVLSFTRILMLPLFVIKVHQGHLEHAGLIILLSGITDLLDGFLARRFKWTTRLGELLDPLADKLTQTCIAVTFIFYIKEFKAYFTIILLKDVLMLLGSYVSYRKDIEIPAAKWFGKVATALFYVTMVLIMMVPTLDIIVKKTLLSLVVISAIFSAAMYASLLLPNLNISKKTL